MIDVVAMSEQDSGMAARVANDQIVPIDLEEASPSKKARQSGVLVECDIVATIQQAVASSVSAHLAPVTQTLQLLQEGQKQQEQKLRDIEAAQALTSSSLVDLQEAHTKRMDSLQAEITQLQKSADSSRPTSPTSPVLSRFAADSGQLLQPKNHRLTSLLGVGRAVYREHS